MVDARRADPGVERREVDAEEPGAVGALQSALSPSLFGEAAVVLVTGVADAPDSVLQALVAGVGDLAHETWVVVQHVGTRNRRSLDQIRALDVPGGVAEVACAEVKRGRPTRELLEAEARAAGRRLTTDGADALVMALGPDIALLVGALEQLMADNPEDQIDSSVVSATFAGVAEVSGFQLADAVWEVPWPPGSAPWPRCPRHPAGHPRPTSRAWRGYLRSRSVRCGRPLPPGSRRRWPMPSSDWPPWMRGLRGACGRGRASTPPRRSMPWSRT
jgi:hypothetical protein